MKTLAILVAATTAAIPAATPSPLEQGFAGALRGCEEWVSNPASWSNGTTLFLTAVGLGNTMGLVETVPSAVLPPENMRLANHYWRINSAPDAGYFLIVSDRLPICHITGGGSADLQPVVEAVLSSPAFAERWEQISVKTMKDIKTTRFRHRKIETFEILISRAKRAGQRSDRLQVLATADLRIKR